MKSVAVTETAKVIVFACNWCGYSALDAAPRNRGVEIRPIVTMCSGRLQPGLILKAFECGASGVAVAGCEKGACRFGQGNQQGQKQVATTQKLLGILGWNPRSVTFLDTAAGDGPGLINKLTEFITTLKPTPVRNE